MKNMKKYQIKKRICFAQLTMLLIYFLVIMIMINFFGSIIVSSMSQRESVEEERKEGKGIKI